MRIKYILDDPDIDRSIELVDELQANGIITDYNSQVLGVDDKEIVLDNVSPSQELTDIVNSHQGYSISLGPDDSSPFEAEDGIPDVAKIGTVPTPNYPINEGNDGNQEVKVFSETDSSEIEIDQNNMAKKNFNDPALDPNGVAVETKEAAVVADQAKEMNDYDPAAGSLDSFDVEPFTDEEIESANNVEVDVNHDGEVKVFDDEECPCEGETEEIDETKIETFSDEEVDAMPSPEEVEAAAEDLNEQVDVFSARKKRLFSARLKLKRLSKKARKMKSFAEELDESEKKDVVEDIVAILQDAPEIKDEVMESIGEVTTMADEEEVVDETAVEEVADAPVEEEATAAIDEVVEEPVVNDTESEFEGDIDAFSDEEIDAAPETEEEDVEVLDEIDVEAPVESEEEEEITEVGKVFCKTFSAQDDVAAYRRQQLDRMMKNSPMRNTRR